ncbi:MAG: hypothetical protein UW81_C0012G0016 [Candidatus Giovannonibacteria bacterium GW2011_GWC2_44_9]|uniref:Uncharacterized protein n=3 Tax=Candidatus Giovannoniibacteriota TaxID=1752738 RepID=A0A0G1IWR1_9BACT|nr:MAG: hypothetical protein UW49_C0010G0013 [Candidatus Giovannonibacteria bacterium GW2011_GWB1_44_23]KKT63428.1 MAG: hypothetical protein UW57_C0007G0016 [Candidatus Giovannonibacteria bacterium GW2011_GWA1_44_29]KKT83727.1 MAG: hypothetical protein UW81_C0012G0016 [Candidatus Giovannonibacteria bacterium GW2011_GWC2_44_9]KKT91462.1 MAG: hypothetical protein UW93_C0006G0013 [Parcubacteria group bacterium GW2011_GWC1_45_13]
MTKQNLQFYIAYEKGEGGGYIASAPAIRGCVVRGKTLKEAHKNIQAAIKECLEVLAKFKKEPPKETLKPKIVRGFSFVKVPEYAKA